MIQLNPKLSVKTSNRKRRSNDPNACDTQSDSQLSQANSSHPARSPSPARSNKYRGPPSTWRSWTDVERELATSLDQLSARDLAVHLFNAFALKNAGRLRQNEGQTKEDSSDRIATEQKWIPPRIWTAWPLAPVDIPRQDYDRRWQADKHTCPDRVIDSKIGSEVMGEFLMGQILNRAKQEFRKWERENPEHPNAAFADNRKPKAHPKSLSLGKTGPEILADDDAALEILRHTIHHILVKLDDILVDMHNARTASLPSKTVTVGSQGEIDEENIEPALHGRKGGSFKSAGGQRKIQSSKSLLASKADPALNDYLPFSATYKGQKSRLSNQPVRSLRKSKIQGLRDWSDVLGVAMMAAWDSKVVQRAVIRCAALFEQGMLIRTLEENGQSALVSAEDVTITNKGFGDNSTTRVPHPRRLEGCTWTKFCPVADCKRSDEGFSTAYSLKRHLKQVHKKLTMPASLHTVDTVNEDEMYGGVCIDGFLHPVTTEIRSKKRRD